MVIIAFNILTRHLELILSTNQGNGHEYVQVCFPCFLFYFIFIIVFIFLMSQKGKR